MIHAVAGCCRSVLSGSGVELRHQLAEMLHPEKELSVLGAVVPHAGYIYSGPVAAVVYSRLPKAETYVILGPNHHGLGSPVALSRDSWRTPLGVALPDLELADALAGTIIDHDEPPICRSIPWKYRFPFFRLDFRISDTAHSHGTAGRRDSRGGGRGASPSH